MTKHNDLIEASYKLTLNEQRLILFSISQVDPRKPLSEKNEFTIHAQEFAEIFGMDEKLVYKEIGDAAKTLAERWIKTHDGKYKEQFRWVYGIRYHDTEGKVTLGFSPWVIPYLTKLHKQFTSYKLDEISNLKSFYSIRLLEFLTQFKTTGKLIIEISKFREQLRLENEYPRFYDLKRWVIEPAVKELQEKSNFVIKWNPLKGNRGKGIKQLEFIFEYNNKNTNSKKNKTSSYGKIKK